MTYQNLSSTFKRNVILDKYFSKFPFNNLHDLYNIF